jgi:hypothetical protein
MKSQGDIKLREKTSIYTNNEVINMLELSDKDYKASIIKLL